LQTTTTIKCAACLVRCWRRYCCCNFNFNTILWTLSISRHERILKFARHKTSNLICPKCAAPTSDTHW